MNPASLPNPPRPFFCGLLRRRRCLVPTWRGWLALLLAAALISAAAMRWTCAFLTVQDSVPGGVLVVEGWMSPADAPVALAEFRAHDYRGLYVTGGPIEKGSPLESFGTYAALTVDVLRRAGADPATLHPVPAPAVARDRTYSMARALRKALAESGVSAARINVITAGPHARRSRLLYQMAFGPETRVGIFAVEEKGFDPARWWRTSVGFRTVTGELIAYAYARFLFTPPAD